MASQVKDTCVPFRRPRRPPPSGIVRVIFPRLFMVRFLLFLGGEGVRVGFLVGRDAAERPDLPVRSTQRTIRSIFSVYVFFSVTLFSFSVTSTLLSTVFLRLV